MKSAKSLTPLAPAKVILISLNYSYWSHWSRWTRKIYNTEIISYWYICVIYIQCENIVLIKPYKNISFPHVILIQFEKVRFIFIIKTWRNIYGYEFYLVDHTKILHYTNNIIFNFYKNGSWCISQNWINVISLKNNNTVSSHSYMNIFW